MSTKAIHRTPAGEASRPPETGRRPAATSSARDAAITTAGLTKRYGKRTAVDSLSLTLPRGVVAGFIGPNGAGKTTTMAMLLGLVRPSEGDATVLGEPLSNAPAYLRRVGALIESPAFYKSLSGERNLEVLAAMGGHDPAGIPRVLDVVGLGERGRDSFRSYSHGMKQRLGIAGALLGDPELLLLDEPTNGLDPAGIREMRELIAGLANERRTVLVSSHVLSELEHVADWLIVIDHGAVRFEGTPSQLSGDGNRIALAAEHAGDLVRLRDVVEHHSRLVKMNERELVVTLTNGDFRGEAADLNRMAAANNITLAEIRPMRTSLEESYFALLQREEGEAA